MFRKQGLTFNFSVARAQPVYRWAHALALLWEQPLWSALMALVIYTLFSICDGAIWSVSQNAYYNYLAHAFLHGQLYLRIIPPSVHDLSIYHGHLYLYWSPMPAIAIMPLVALFGVQLNDVIFTVLIAALNVALVAMILRLACVERVIKLSKVRRGLLVVCFALGTVQLTLAPFGRVWSTGQQFGFMCVALGYLIALQRRGAWAFALVGVTFSAALLTRNHLVFAGLWPGCYLLYQHRSASWQRRIWYILLGVLPLVLAVALLGAYNWLRFGSIWDNGLDYHDMASIFVADYGKYGAFNLHYLPTNLFYQYVAYPLPLRIETFYGGSLFLLTPVFMAIFPGIIGMRSRWSMYALLGSVVLVATPILLLMGTGWVQFGPRYTLDFTIPLLLLTATGLRYWRVKTLSILTIISITHYMLGTIYLARSM